MGLPQRREGISSARTRIHIENRIGIKSLSKMKTAPNLDLLVRRDRSQFVFEKKPHNSWSDFHAWIASCLFHTTILVAFALLWRPQMRGTSEESDRPIGIAMANESNDANEFSLEGGASGANSASSASSKIVSMAIENTNGPPISVESILSNLVGNQTGPSENSLGTDGSIGKGMAGEGGSGSSTGGRGRGSGSGTKTKTSFFGVEGSGSSFVYVVDRSDSMNDYGSSPLRYAKKELLKSLESLTEYNQFQIVFYNDSLSPMSSQMIFATDGNKGRANNFVRNMPGDGSTRHLPALKQGLAMVPEVIFFLTDADDPSLTMPQLLEIQRRADLARTTIHTIQFKVGPASNDGSWIRELALMNRGTYTYIDVTSLNSPLEKRTAE